MINLPQSFKQAGTAIALTSALMMGATTASADGARFYEKDASDLSVKVAQYGAGKVSNKLGGVTFLVYGGNEKLVNTARNVAKRLNAEGMPVGFIKAVDRDTIDETMTVAFYTKGGTKFYSLVYDNDKNTVQENEQELYSGAKKAYEYEFGEKIVKKSPTNDAPVLAQR